MKIQSEIFTFYFSEYFLDLLLASITMNVDLEFTCLILSKKIKEANKTEYNLMKKRKKKEWLEMETFICKIWKWSLILDMVSGWIEKGTEQLVLVLFLFLLCFLLFRESFEYNGFPSFLQRRFCLKSFLILIWSTQCDDHIPKELQSHPFPTPFPTGVGCKTTRKHTQGVCECEREKRRYNLVIWPGFGRDVCFLQKRLSSCKFQLSLSISVIHL